MTYEQKAPAAPPTPEHMAAIAKFTEEQAKAGVLVMTGGLRRPAKGTRVKLAKGEFTTDGPFAETKELIDGFALIDVPNREAAIEVARKFMTIAGDGEGEILEVFDAPLPPKG
jgi:hypothetical protein